MTTVERRLRLGLFLVMFALSAAYTWAARDFLDVARYAPLFGGSLATALFGTITVREAVLLRRADRVARQVSRSMEYQDKEDLTSENLRQGVKYLTWIVGFAVGTWALGLQIAAPLFIGLFMGTDRETSAREAVVSVAGVVVLLYVFGRVGLVWPQGALLRF